METEFGQDVGTTASEQQSDISVSSEVTGRPRGRQELAASTTGWKGEAVTHRNHSCAVRQNEQHKAIPVLG